MEMDTAVVMLIYFNWFLCMRMSARGNHNSEEIPLQKLVYVSAVQYIFSRVARSSKLRNKVPDIGHSLTCIS
jgi:hypothetical protein